MPTTHVDHVQQALLREFGEIVDMSNVETQQTEEIARQRISRCLAALTVRRLTDCDSQTAAGAVVDGRNDQGIDAIAFGVSSPELFLVQSKWSNRGSAGIDMAAAQKLVDGFRKIEAREFGRFNPRFKPKSEKIATVLREPNVRVVMVVAVLGDGHLAPEVEAVFEDARREFNGFGPLLDYRVVNGAEFLSQVREDLAGPDVSLSVPMRQWLHRSEPTDAYQGSVAADEVAAWYSEHGDRLFDRNVRRSLGLTPVNQGMVETLRTDPVSFWSRNNGVTILCSEIETSFWGSRRSHSEPVELRLRKASVVNGAQTVSAVHEANVMDPESVREADVSVRVIRVPDGVDHLGEAITRSTNTQNHMERRDFIALDPVQISIREDFALSLEKTYTFKRGDMDPAPDAGCSVVHAGLALACAHRNSDLVVRAKRDLDLLWEESSGGAYPQLFGNQPAAQQIWRSVLLFRAISGQLHLQAAMLDGRAAAIVEHGDLIIAHLVFRFVGSETVEDPDRDWEDELGQVPELVERASRWLIDQVDRQFGSSSYLTSTFANPERCRLLVSEVLRCLEAGGSAPEISDEYRPSAQESKSRARPAVHVLLDAGRIDAGAMLHYMPSTDRERAALGSWLADDTRRGQASWVPERGRPLLWAANGRRYSPRWLIP